jgi:hypothetical protein
VGKAWLGLPAPTHTHFFPGYIPVFQDPGISPILFWAQNCSVPGAWFIIPGAPMVAVEAGSVGARLAGMERTAPLLLNSTAATRLTMMEVQYSCAHLSVTFYWVE